MTTKGSLLIILLSLAFFQLSCRKGCIDENALNYQPEANSNTGCIYPETFNLTSVGINYYPPKDFEGNDWDISSEPDKLVKILNHETNQILHTTDVEEFSPVNWTINPELSVNVEEVILRFELYDEDENAEVLMDQLILNLKGLTGKAEDPFFNDFYPESAILEGENGAGFSITATWTQ